MDKLSENLSNVTVDKAILKTQLKDIKDEVESSLNTEKKENTTSSELLIQKVRLQMQGYFWKLASFLLDNAAKAQYSNVSNKRTVCNNGTGWQIYQKE